MAIKKLTKEEYINYRFTNNERKKILHYFIYEIKFLPKDKTREFIKGLWNYILNKLPKHSLRHIYLWQLIRMNFNDKEK